MLNGFQLAADSYRKYLEKNPDDPNRKSLEKSIKINEFLSTCSQDDIFEIYNTSAFNNITEGYCRKAAEGIGLDKEQIKTLIGHLHYLHDTLTAGEVI